MLLPASYRNGFAPRDGQPLYPSLWKGCCGAWNPGLGPSGLVLRDNSGFKNNGTLTGGPTFVANQGKYAMSFDGVDDYVPVLNKDICFPKANFTYSFWVNRLGGNYCLSDYNSAGSQSGIAFSFSGLKIQAFWENDGFPMTTSTTDLTSGQFFCVGFTWDGSIRRLYINGVQEGTNANAQARPSAAPGKLTIGRAGDFASYASCQMNDLMVWSRCLSPDEIRTLATRRGIAYEMAPRRRSQAQVTTNRLRRALIGS